MATYYVELDGGQLTPDAALKGGTMSAAVSFSGAVIYPSAGGGGANLETKTVAYTPSELELSQTLLPSAGYDGFDEVDVTVHAIPSDYVGSDIPLCDSSDVETTITDTNFIRSHSVDVADGYYENPVSLLNPFGNATFAPVGAPYVDPSTGDLTVQFKADTAGMAYTKSSYSITDEGAFNVKGAQTYTPGTTDQTIGSGYLLTGNQTILGDADLVAGNIKKDVEIFGVTGTYEGGGGGDLPEGYEAYDYIALNLADGTSYQSNNYAIIAPIAMSSDYTFETKIMYNSASNAAAFPILGTRVGTNGAKEFGLFYTPSNGRCGYWIDGRDSTDAGNWFVAGAVNSVEFLPVGKDETYPTRVAIKVNGTSHNSGSSSTGATFSPWLGFFKYASSATGTTGNATYYGLKIGETKIKDGNGVLLHDLVPCLLGGIYAGFYDTIAEAFYTNVAQYSKFTVGNWTNPSPQEVLDIVFGD